ncbi:MAG: hypothetical protein ACIAQ0_14410 [Phycisphaerales bacterium JB058]
MSYNNQTTSAYRSHAPVYADMVLGMSGSALRERKPTRAPLSEAEIKRAQRVADRLHSDLGIVVSQLPEQAQGGSGMSRYLDIVRNTTQRICYALQDPASLATLSRVPGVKGLESFVEAVRRVGVTKESADLLEASVNEFSRLIDDIAGSHTKLIDRVDAGLGGPRPPGGGNSDLAARANLFAAASQVTGGSTQTAVAINIIDLEGDTLSRTYIHGFIHATMEPGGMPLVVCSGDNFRWAKGAWDRKLLDDTGLEGRTPTALLEPFTTTPFPEITGRGDNGQLLQVIDPKHVEPGMALDVVTATRTKWPFINPETKESAFERVWYLVNWPVQNLVFDVWIHEKLERMFRPSVDALLWYPKLSIAGGDRWATRFPSQTKLELLGRGIGSADSAMWHRHGELTEHTFKRIGEDANEYVGFRCEMQFPIWRAGYCMSFEEIAKRGT